MLDLMRMSENIRLSKLMAERGLCSRREADEWIAKGWVKVNGQITDVLGIRVPPDCEIELSPGAHKDSNSRVTILLNKPIGYVSGQPEKDYLPAVRLITDENHERAPGDILLERFHFDGLAPAGRLDIDSQGLLVFTQDGTVAKTLIGEHTEVEKEYLVRVHGRLSDRDLKLLNHGLSLDGKPLKPAKVEWLNEDQLRFVLREGKKRQIRRMCEMMGLEVLGLKRVRIGNIRLGSLAEGHWRFLAPGERF
jgi:23S rRNA pseudouridine2604 synthase